jgi:branched-chain amino acid transport system permease protein
MGTLYGGIVGATFYMATETFLPDLQHLAKDVFPNAMFLHNALERWYLVLGTLFILIVIFFPKGVIGSVRDYLAKRK